MLQFIITLPCEGSDFRNATSKFYSLGLYNLVELKNVHSLIHVLLIMNFIIANQVQVSLINKIMSNFVRSQFSTTPEKSCYFLRKGVKRDV